MNFYEFILVLTHILMSQAVKRVLAAVVVCLFVCDVTKQAAVMFCSGFLLLPAKTDVWCPRI